MQPGFESPWGRHFIKPASRGGLFGAWAEGPSSNPWVRRRPGKAGRRRGTRSVSAQRCRHGGTNPRGDAILLKANAKVLAFNYLRSYWCGFLDRFYTLFYTTCGATLKMGTLRCYGYSQPANTMANTSNQSSGSSLPRNTRKKRLKTRDLSKALKLRPNDIWELYGIPSSTLCLWCKHPRPGVSPPPSLKIEGRQGRRGIRLFDKLKFEAWLEENGRDH